MKRIMLGGNDAVAYAVKQSFVDVISAYPITPQTSIIEKIAVFISNGKMDTKFIKVESEHSAMAAMMGASVAGARTFTATSSQGLLLMHEVLHWASAARLPIVMANANRAIAPPWNIWAEQTDSLSQRDTGWFQFYASNAQEVYDFIFIAFKAAEKSRFPAMVCLDGFLLTHTKEPISMFDDEEIEFYIKEKPQREVIDFEYPKAFGSLAFPNEYMKIKVNQHKDMLDGIKNIESAMEQFAIVSSRKYVPIEIYGKIDASISIVTSGTLSETAKIAVDKLNEDGIDANLVKISVFRPFPREHLKKAFKNTKQIVVLDRNISHGKGGIMKDEIAGGLNLSNVIGYVCGLGGFDVTEDDIIRGVIDIVSGKVNEDSIMWSKQ